MDSNRPGRACLRTVRAASMEALAAEVTVEVAVAKGVGMAQPLRAFQLLGSRLSVGGSKGPMSGLSELSGVYGDGRCWSAGRTGEVLCSGVAGLTGAPIGGRMGAQASRISRCALFIFSLP